MSDQQPPAVEKRRLSPWLTGAIFFVGVAVLIVAIALLYPDQSNSEPTADPGTTTTTLAPATVPVSAGVTASGEEPVADAAEKILPSVVYIETDAGLGSGVIYDESGLIVTAAHVVDGFDTVRVRFADGEQVEGTVLGENTDVDVAVIQVGTTGLPAASFNTGKPRVGQLAIAVGSPWGLESTVTAGIISAVDQTNCSFTTCSSMIQTDAAINPGNSGGALVNRDGEVVGLNVSIFSTSGANDGVGFAVPSDTVVDYADSIISGEPLETAYLGIRFNPQDVVTEGQAGAVIEQVEPNTPAAQAGVEANDVVIAFDGVRVLNGQDLQAQVRAHRPGDTVDMIVQRGNDEITLTVTLGVNTATTG